MRAQFTLFRRGKVFYAQDVATGKQQSLRTRDEREATVLLNAKNESVRQSSLNLQIARAYLTGSDPVMQQRTWQTVMDQFQTHGKESSKTRYLRAMKSKSFDELRKKRLIETNAQDLLATMSKGKVSVIHFLKRLHNLALALGWLPVPVLAPKLWPVPQAKPKRGITAEEHQRILAMEHNAERNLFYQLLWDTGASQSDAAHLTADCIDWGTRTLTYFRMKTGEMAQLTIGKRLETILRQLPTQGPIFPKINKSTDGARSSEFCRRCRVAGITGISLHSYRYAWAERAKSCGFPERFAQAALGHNSKAVHRAYARKALVVIPTMEDYEKAIRP